jgi:type II secretory pathway component PulK
MSEVIFLSLYPDLDADAFITEREDALFESVADFVSRLQQPVDEEGLSVDTRFFRAHGQIQQADKTFNMTTLIYRDKEGDTQIINRTLGQF